MEEVYRNVIEVPERGYHYFRHYFLPHEGNDHRPIALRPHALRVYAVAMLIVKLALTGWLYAIYPDSAYFAELTETKILELTNVARTKNGLAPLSLDPQLSRSAHAKAEDMVRQGYFEHTNPDGKKFWQWIREAGYGYTTAGENLAMDFTTAESAHNALMASPSHRSNLLKTRYTQIGLAVVQGTIHGRKTTLLVQHFGRPTAALATTQKARSSPTAQRPPATQPAKQSALPSLTKPAYRAEAVGRSDERLALLPGSTVDIWMDFKNTGSATWQKTGKNFIALNVTDPPGRTSGMKTESWVAAYRPALLEQETVAPGTTGRFRFTLRAPETAGSYLESFGMVAENFAWVEGGTVALPIDVVQPAVAGAQEPKVEQTPPQETAAASLNTTAVDVTSDPTAEAIPAALAESGALVVRHEAAPDWQRIGIEWSVRFFWGFLLFLTLALFIHLAAHPEVPRHRHVIVQTVLVLVLTATMLIFRFHFAEHLTRILVT